MATNRITTGRWRISSDELELERQPDCIRQSLPARLGHGHYRIFQLDQGLSYIETRYAPTADLAVLSRMDCEEPRLVVTLGLQGRSRFAADNGNDMVFNEGYTAITAIRSSAGERQYQAQKQVLQLRFALNKHWLDRYVGESASAKLFGKPGAHLLNCQPISPQAIHLARQLLDCDTSKPTGRMLMHGHAMSLLASELNRLTDNRDLPTFEPQDAAIAQAARDILSREFKHPPSVAELAKRVGTNQCKLKKLFHRFFDSTPYGVLLDIRMQQAYRLLESRRCQVGVAADLVGYNQAGNFSAAFTRYFGVAPKHIGKKH
ncbi:MAG: helix-turn-helix transcriptional regulator [Methylobacter sp.]